jgi:ribosome biogenesis protein Nip4
LAQRAYSPNIVARAARSSPMQILERVAIFIQYLKRFLIFAKVTMGRASECSKMLTEISGPNIKIWITLKKNMKFLYTKNSIGFLIRKHPFLKFFAKRW